MPNLKIPAKPAPNLKINPDLVEAGNIDLKKRPKLRNPDGSYSTVFTHTFPLDEKNPNGPAVNVPGVIRTGARPGSYIKVPDGRKGEQMAWEAFKKTNEHLGIHKSLKAAIKAAEKLHEDQANFYGK